MADYDTYFRDWRRGDVRPLSSSPIQGVGANLDPVTVGSNVALTTSIPVPPVAKAPTRIVNVSPETIILGGTATVAWTNTNA